MKIKHEHIESVLLALAAEKGQAWVANAITEEYLRQGGGELPLVPGKDWNNQQNIYHRWLKGETEAQREKIQKLIPAILAILPRELRHRLCIFDTLERRALLAAQEALSLSLIHIFIPSFECFFFTSTITGSGFASVTLRSVIS